MAEVEKEIKKGEKKIINFFSSKSNIWMSVSIVLAILLILSFALSSSMGNISKEKAASLVSSYATSQGASVSIVNVTSLGKLYEVMISYQGQDIPFYVSKDGKYLGQMTAVKSSISSTTPATSTDKDKCSSDAATRMGLDSQKIDTLAFSAEGINLLKAEQNLNTKYGVSGSPTLIINGVETSAIYAGTDATKSAICSAFTTATSECNGVATNNSGVIKSVKPVVELFVMSYCPYGVRAETNIAPLQELFNNKIDLKIRFIVNVGGDTIDSVQSLHGITEAKEDARQLAIMQLYPDKYWAYLTEFNNVCYGGGAPSSGSCG